jgi:1-deoxy-D-xylulose 5-phosphate reductoisomerase
VKSDIAKVVEAVLAQFSAGDDLDLTEILAADRRARELAEKEIGRKSLPRLSGARR